MLVRVLPLFLLLSAMPSLAAQAPVQLRGEDATVQAFLQALEGALSTVDRDQWRALLSPAAQADPALEFFDAAVQQGVTRVVVKERDRVALEGSLPGEGFTLILEVFLESGPTGRIATWRLDIRRPRGDDSGPQPWHIVAHDRLAFIEGLHRLSLNVAKQFRARDLVLRSVDFELRLPAGDVFVSETPDGVTALALMGDGTLVFTPAPREEQGQLRLFSGDDTLESSFTTAFVRVNPYEFDQRMTGALEPANVDARTVRRGQSVFDEGVPKSFNLDLSDLSREVWSLLPQSGDFVAEVRTRRHGELTYARSSSEAEDVSLFQRSRRRNISVYASEQKLASRGRFFDEDDYVEYDMTDYDVDAAFSPEREWMEGRARLTLRVTSFALGGLTLKLADSLNVSSVTSDQYGRLLFLRVRNQNSVLINLPEPMSRGQALELTIAYAGRLEPAGIQDESIDGTQRIQRADLPDVPAEPKWLFSNRSYWYPQAQVTDYATARMRITVPVEFGVVGSGVLEAGSPEPAPPSATDPGEGERVAYTFLAPQPLRYLSILVTRMTRVDATTVVLDIVPPPPAALDLSGASTLAEQLRMMAQQLAAVPVVGARNTVQVAVVANRRQESKGREGMADAADIIRLYAGIIGDMPYDAVTVAMVEDEVPGGHAPAYFALINNPPPITSRTWRNDPAAFSSFPEFFLAHELAHQWFGQAVGWKNYHEQWLSEGFAQYFAALFAREHRGEGVFRDILKQFRRWSIAESDQGPIYLGYRLGHIKGESRVFRALVYNKGASVLHMLRGLVGDDVFFAGVRRFYADNRFTKAGTDDLRRAMEAESGQDLERFFERWIYDSGIPRLRFSSAVDGQDLVVRFEQVGEVFDLPVTVTVSYTDGTTAEHVVPVREATVERRLPLTGPLRSVDVNEDNAAVAVIDKR